MRNEKVSLNSVLRWTETAVNPLPKFLNAHASFCSHKAVIVQITAVKHQSPETD